MDIYQQRFTVFGDGKTVTSYPILHNFYIETTRWGIQSAYVRRYELHDTNLKSIAHHRRISEYILLKAIARTSQLLTEEIQKKKAHRHV